MFMHTCTNTYTEETCSATLRTYLSTDTHQHKPPKPWEEAWVPTMEIRVFTNFACVVVVLPVLHKEYRAKECRIMVAEECQQVGERSRQTN